MRFIADLHIHSPYSRATSKDMEIESLCKVGSVKGPHCYRYRILPTRSGFLTLKINWKRPSQACLNLRLHIFLEINNKVPQSCRRDVRFILSAEISCIYSKNGKTRKVHNLLLAPSFEAVQRINDALSKIGNLKSDGRPILGLDSKVLLKIALDVSPDVMFIPAHAWTPHFLYLVQTQGLIQWKSVLKILHRMYSRLRPDCHPIRK